MSAREEETRERAPSEETAALASERPAELPAKYEVLGILGSGGMGMVLHARDRTLDREVAVKVIARRHADSERFVQRFLTEARAAARINHPDIVQIYEFGEERGGYYLAMEFVDGGSFADTLKRIGRMSELDTIAVGRSACRALGAAHAAGIVHRDVKPDNMMRTRSGEFKLVDLGLAKCLVEDSSQTQSGQSLGTPHYISPEQVMGAKMIDRRSDLYSLGASMYHLATGRFPFEGSSAPHIMSRHLNDPLPDPRQFVPELGDGFCRILGKLMAKEPAARHQNTAELDADLALLQHGCMPPIAEPETCALDASLFGPPLTPADLDAIESALAAAIGPLAKVLVRKSARGASSRDALCRELAGQINDDGQRRRFLATTSSSGGLDRTSGAGGGASAPTSGAATPTPDWDPARLREIEGRLARAIGPVAGVLLRRESRRAADLPALLAALAGSIPDAAARAAFLADARDRG